MVLYEIITTYPIFHDHCTRDDIMMHIISLGTRPDEKYVLEAKHSIHSALDNRIFVLLSDIMRRCWDKDPQSRPTGNESRVFILGFKILVFSIAI